MENVHVVGGKREKMPCIMLVCKNTLNNYSENVKAINDLIYIEFLNSSLKHRSGTKTKLTKKTRAFAEGKIIEQTLAILHLKLVKLIVKA